MTLLTISAIAQSLGKSESTIRYYRDQYSDYLPYVGDGRRRLYRPEALTVLRKVCDCYAAGMAASAIKAILASEFAVNIQEQLPQPCEVGKDANPQNKTDLGVFAEVRDEIATLRRAQERTNDLLEAIIEARRTAREAPAPVMQEKKLAKRNWLSRLLGL